MIVKRVYIMGKKSRGRSGYVSCDKCGMRLPIGKAHISYRRGLKQRLCVRCAKKAKLTGKGRIQFRRNARK